MASRRISSKRTITNSLSDIQRRLKYVESKSSPSRLANQVVKRTNIQPRAISTDQIALSSITNSLIEAETITAGQIAVNAITNSELAPNSVDTENFRVGSVDNNALAPNSVGASNYQPDSVGRDAIEENAVGSNEIANGAVNEDKLNNNAVTGSKIKNGVVSTDKIANFSITATKMAGQSVGAVNIVENDSIGTRFIAGAGLSVSRTNRFNGSQYSYSADYGSGSNQVARGNHTHGITSLVTNTGNPTFGVAHTHVYLRAASPTAIPSTKRVKTNISTHSIENPKKILNLEPKRYKYKNSLRSLHSGKNKEWLYGYIAEEALELGLEEIVGYDKKGKPNSLDYSLISLFLVELAKVHENEINLLKEEIQRLKESK